MADQDHITGIILAGGKSSRMGVDKGQIKIHGSSFIELIIKAIEPLVTKILIVSSNDAYDKFGFDRIEDEIKDSGPLAGLYSGLKNSQTELNLVLSCDVPLVTSEILKQLLNSNCSDYDIVQFGIKDQTLPLIALYHKRCAPRFLELLQKGEKRLRSAVREMRVKTLKVAPEFEGFLKNINTQDELKEIQWN